MQQPDSTKPAASSLQNIQKQSLAVGELYGIGRQQDTTACLLASYVSSQNILDIVVNDALKIIVDNEYKKKVPDFVIDELDTLIAVGLNLHFKSYDADKDQDLKDIVDPDEEPAAIAIDTWARGNLVQ